MATPLPHNAFSSSSVFTSGYAPGYAKLNKRGGESAYNKETKNQHTQREKRKRERERERQRESERHTKRESERERVREKERDNITPAAAAPAQACVGL